MYKYLLTGVVCFLIGLLSATVMRTEQGLEAEPEAPPQLVQPTEERTGNLDTALNSDGFRAQGKQALAAEVPSSKVAGDVEGLADQNWVAVIEELSYAPYDDLSLLKLAIEIAESPLGDQLAFLSSSFEVQNPSEDIQYIQRFLLKNLAKDNVQLALDVVDQLSFEQRDIYGNEVVKGYLRSEPVEAFNWLANSARADTDFLSKKEVARFQAQAIKQFVRREGDLYEAYGLTQGIAQKRARYLTQRGLAEEMLEGGAQSALSYASTAGPEGQADKKLVSLLVGQWAATDPQQSVQYLVENADMIDRRVVQPLSENLIANGHAAEYDRFYHSIKDDEIKAWAASYGAIGQASQQDLDAAIDWYEKIPEENRRAKLVSVRGTVMTFGPDHSDLDAQLNFIESATEPNSNIRNSAYERTLKVWRDTDPEAVEEFVMSLPLTQVDLRNQLIKKLKLNNS